jgi:hypothetical protein
MSALIISMEHAFAAAAQDVMEAAKFVETGVLPALQKAQTEVSIIEAVTALGQPSGGQHRVLGFATLGAS